MTPSACASADRLGDAVTLPDPRRDTSGSSSRLTATSPTRVTSRRDQVRPRICARSFDDGRDQGARVDGTAAQDPVFSTLLSKDTRRWRRPRGDSHAAVFHLRRPVPRSCVMSPTARCDR